VLIRLLIFIETIVFFSYVVFSYAEQEGALTDVIWGLGEVSSRVDGKLESLAVDCYNCYYCNAALMSMTG